MLKKLLLTLSLTSIVSFAYAESCPSINDLKQNNLHGWTIYDINDGIPITDPKATKDYEYNTRAFGLAEWASGAPEGEAHCYYYHQNPNMGYGAAYLAKANLISSNNFVWRNSKNQQCTVKDDNCQCKAGDEACGFVSTT